MKELWRNIDGYKGMYQISSIGRVRSYKYKNPRILKPRKNNNGYLYINLSIDGKYKSFTIHRLVAIYFLGKSNLTVNHKNCNKLNNCVENLEWISQQKNTDHAKLNNLLSTGERNGRSKLIERDIKVIKYKSRLGKSSRTIAKEFGVSKTAIQEILNNISWK